MSVPLLKRDNSIGKSITLKQDNIVVSKLAVLMLFVLGFCFGGMFTLNRIVTTDNVPILSYVFWQALGASTVILIACGIKNTWPPIRSLNILRIYLFLALLNFVVPFLILAITASRVPAGVLSIGLALIPLSIYAMSLPFKLENFRFHKIVGLLLGLAGVLLILIPKSSLPSPDMAGWVALSLIAPLCWALRSVLLPFLRPAKLNSLQLIAGLLVFSTLILGVIILVDGNFWAFQSGFGLTEIAILLAMLNNAIMMVLIWELIKLTGPLFFSTSNYIATLVGVAAGIGLFGDKPSFYVWLAVGLVFMGLFFVNFWDWFILKIRN